MDRRTFLTNFACLPFLASSCRFSSGNDLRLSLDREPMLGSYSIVSARPDFGFDWPYFLFLPSAWPKRVTPIVIGPNNLISRREAKLQREILTWRSWIERNLCERLKQPVIVPAFVRPKVPSIERNLYTHALSRQTILSKEPRFVRIDLQVLAMIDHARSTLKEICDATINDQNIAFGFSASGDFATRLATIHPEYFDAVVAGGLGGLPILPISEFGNRPINYPVGVGDFEVLMRKPFNVNAFKRVRMLLMQGERDRNDSVPSADSYSQAQADFIMEKFGMLPVERVELVRSIFAEFGMVEFSFEILLGEGHSMTDNFFSNSESFLRRYSL